MMKVSGKLKLINETKSYGEKGFRKREVVLETNEQYPQVLLIEFIQDKCDLLNSFSKDDEVSIDLNLKGREFINKAGETKYFNSFQGWKIVEFTKQKGVETPFGTAISSPFDDANDEEVPF